MNELDPTTLKRNDWIYWTYNNRVHQGWFISIVADDIYVILGFCGVQATYPLKAIRLFSEYPSDTHFGMHKIEDGFIDERAG